MYEGKYLIQIIKYLLQESDSVLVPPERTLDWRKLVTIAERHNIVSFLHYALPKLPKEFQPNKEIGLYIRNIAMGVAAIDIQQKLEKEALYQNFEKHSLYCLPVKGLETKEFYPKSEWRTMGDFDILYKTEQHQEVKKMLLQMGYSNFESGLKHDHYSKEPYVSLEMHRVLVTDIKETEEHYENIWKLAQPRQGFRYVYQMSLEEQYIYTMVHLAEHFLNGGIGIRFIIDIYVLGRQNGLNRLYIEEMFEKMKISEFANNIEMLAHRWFGEETVLQEPAKTDVLDELETFIIRNGIYGKAEHGHALVLQKEGRIGYMRRMVFPNFDSMKTLYPWLVGKAYLLPIAWVVRIIRTVLFRKKSIQSGINTIRYNDLHHGRELQEFYKKCGI